jgi:hypothetical protein
MMGGSHFRGNDKCCWGGGDSSFAIIEMRNRMINDAFLHTLFIFIKAWQRS